MKINKLKLLSLFICCLVAALCPIAQCMDNVQDQGRNDVPASNHQTAICPTGGIITFAGEIAPEGWLICDGKRYTSLNYPELYEVIKTKYVPDNEQWIIKANENSTIEKFFHVPDLRGRVIVGVDDKAGRVTSNNTLGASGGEEKHLLQIGEVAYAYTTLFYHTHGTDTLVGKIHTTGNGRKELEGVAMGNHPHNNMQPYLVLNFIINSGKKHNSETKLLNDEIYTSISTVVSHEKKFTQLMIQQSKSYFSLVRAVMIRHNQGDNMMNGVPESTIQWLNSAPKDLEECEAKMKKEVSSVKEMMSRYKLLTNTQHPCWDEFNKKYD